MIHRFCADVRKEGMGVASDDWQSLLAKSIRMEPENAA